METSRIERENMRKRQVEEFLASDMSTAQWAPLNGTSVSNLRYWIRKYKGDNQTSDSAPLQLTAVKPIFGIATS